MMQPSCAVVGLQLQSNDTHYMEQSYGLSYRYEELGTKYITARAKVYAHPAMKRNKCTAPAESSSAQCAAATVTVSVCDSVLADSWFLVQQFY